MRGGNIEYLVEYIDSTV